MYGSHIYTGSRLHVYEHDLAPAKTAIIARRLMTRESIVTEAEIIANTLEPRTRPSLVADLKQLGVEPGMAVLVHSSLSSLGWVNGGSVAVIQALQDVLTPQGTLIMPAHSGDLSDPAGWKNPPVPDSWCEVIRETMPAYDPCTTHTRAIGRVAEHFRTWPGVQRSEHPTLSFCAWGRYAGEITRDHQLDDSLGEGSPLARLYDLNCHVLLLGVGYDSNTSFHLAEYRIPQRQELDLGAPILQEGQRRWITYRDIILNSDPFPQLGEAFESKGSIRTGRVGSATCRLFRQRLSVDYAVEWLQSRSSKPAK
jgi:aminoglycoside 3-N-acetyltransferase